MRFFIGTILVSVEGFLYVLLFILLPTSLNWCLLFRFAKVFLEPFSNHFCVFLMLFMVDYMEIENFRHAFNLHHIIAKVINMWWFIYLSNIAVNNLLRYSWTGIFFFVAGKKLIKSQKKVNMTFWYLFIKSAIHSSIWANTFPLVTLTPFTRAKAISATSIPTLFISSNNASAIIPLQSVVNFSLYSSPLFE